jgi:hypothetical protein
MNYAQAVDAAGNRRGDQTGKRITLANGRHGTVIYSYCCVADRRSGVVHLDGDPLDVHRVANWF